MAQDLQSGFKNNINLLCVRTSGSSLQVVTDRRVDFNNDGTRESVTVINGVAVSNTASGNKMKPPSQPSTAISVIYETPGVAHSVVSKPTETDGGVDTSGQTFTIDDD